MRFSRSGPALRLRFLWLVIGYALVLLVVFMSLTSNPIEMGELFPYEDKVYHAFAYFTLMAWFAQIYHDRFQRNMIAAVFVFMGVALEYLQSFDPDRMAEFADMVANTTGVALGMALAMSSWRNVLVWLEGLVFKS